MFRWHRQSSCQGTVRRNRAQSSGQFALAGGQCSPTRISAPADPEHPSSHKSIPVPDRLNEAELLSKEGTRCKACLIALKLVLRNHRH